MLNQRKIRKNRRTADEVMAETIAAVDQALAEGKISEETAEYLKAGYEAALNFADGDVSEANKLFNDLVRYGNHPAFGADPSVTMKTRDLSTKNLFYT